MLYYTQLIYIKPGQEEAFHAFESQVLPLLSRYNGRLLLRIRPNKACVIEANDPVPYEIHILTFGSKADLDAFAADPKRQKVLELKTRSIDRAVLIEGRIL
ncbi:MAG: hypothetical protein V3V08_08100 [Nannocystaceae bacterium]